MIYLPFLQNSFLYNFALPFALIFAILYSILTSTNVISNKNSCVIIALVLSLFAMIYPATSGIIISFAPFIAILFFIIFFLKIILNNISGIANNQRDAKEIAIMLFFFLIALDLIARTISVSELNISMQTFSNILWSIGFVIILLIIYISLKYGKSNSYEQTAE